MTFIHYWSDSKQPVYMRCKLETSVPSVTKLSPRSDKVYRTFAISTVLVKLETSLLVSQYSLCFYNN